MLEFLIQDIRYGLRGLRREPGFAIFAVLIIAIGIGACVTVFSVLNTVLIRPLPFREPERLVWIENDQKEQGLSDRTFQTLTLKTYHDRNRHFEDIAGYMAFYGPGDAQLTRNGASERVNSIPITQNFFPMLGVQPQLGRNFSDAESKPNGPRATILSHAFWTSHFNADPSIVGRALTIDNGPVTVVGVLPASFDFGSVFAPGVRADLFYAFPVAPETDRYGNTMLLIGRLKPGADLAPARAEAQVLGPAIQREVPRRNGVRLRLMPLRDYVSGRIRPALMVLGFAVVAVMLIVCANLANLLFARGTSRAKEFAIRTALGAGKGRLVRQILTESVLLSCAGGLLGTVLAWLSVRAVAGLSAFSIPLLSTVRLDTTALLCAVTLGVGAGVVFGLLPAFQAPVVAVNDALKQQNRSRRQTWIRGSLVAVEMAFACVLIASSGVLLRSLLRVLDVDLGFQPARAATLRIDPSFEIRTQAQFNAYINEALRRVRSLNGVEAAGLTDALPMVRNRTWGAAAKGEVYKPENYPTALVHVVSSGYFRAMGIPFAAGREFDDHDQESTEAVIIINEALARQLWPGQNPLGRLMRAGNDRDKHVVGVVKDVHQLGVEERPGPQMFLPLTQGGDRNAIDLVVRSRHDVRDLTALVMPELLQVDAGMPRETFRPMQAIVDRTTSPRRFIVWLITAFAGFALLLASLGIYAVVSYTVGQRKREIGIRMALGATPEALQRSVLGQTLRLAAVGMAIGLVASRAVTEAIAGLLFGVKPGDWVTFGAMVAALLMVALGAGFLPARRASKVDPMLVLRAD